MDARHGRLHASAAYALSFGTDIFLRLTNRTVIKKPYCISEEAMRLHRSLDVADLHCDALLSNRDLLQRSLRGHVDIPRLVEGNVALQVFAIPTLAPVRAGIPWMPVDADAITLLVVAHGWPPPASCSTFERARHAGKLLRSVEARSDGAFRIITSAPELEAFLQARRGNTALTAGLLAIEGLHCLEGSLENLDVLYRAGFRMGGLVHLGNNDLGGSAHGRNPGGLTAFGADVLAYMAEKRMVVDLAHASPQLLDDVLGRETPPPIISHTGLQGAHNNERNISDAAAVGIAEKGGLVGIGFFPWAIGVCSLDALMNTLLYAVNLVGTDHVALGSDFDGMVATPFDASGVPLITERLLRHGCSDEDIRKIMGGNVLRFLRDALPAT